MHLVAAGLSFRSAPISVRERAVVPPSEANRLLRYLVGHCGLRGAAVLSTCNRTEFYVSCPTDALADEVRPRLAMYLDPVDDSDVGDHLFELRGADAIRHMLRVAGGLESMVVGEAQVLGQFRDAHQLARDAGTLDARLDYVLRRAVSAGKRVRTKTTIGRRSGSIAHAAVQVARELAGDLHGRGVLVLGAGTMSALAAARMHDAGARVMIASRGGDSALALASRLTGDALAINDPIAKAAEIEVVICCTDSSAPVLSAGDVAAMQERRGHRPLTVIDIAVPRDVEAGAGDVAGVTLIDVDALGDRIASGGSPQRSALAEATAIIEAEVARAIAVVAERDTAGPTIGALVRQAEAIRRQEVERTLARMPDVDAATADKVQQLTRGIVSKLLHAPISHLREFADDPGVALTLRDAFELDTPDLVDGESAASDAAAS
ncbi:MAG: glutamyl-tRNA reductase [Candidatus Dormibacteraeota bacterium]|nr:glutamyl-tRNA reductase [Candidatus Dormibacteraeota bacterium]